MGLVQRKDGSSAHVSLSTRPSMHAATVGTGVGSTVGNSVGDGDDSVDGDDVGGALGFVVGLDGGAGAGSAVGEVDGGGAEGVMVGLSVVHGDVLQRTGHSRRS